MRLVHKQDNGYNTKTRATQHVKIYTTQIKKYEITNLTSKWTNIH